MLCDRVDLEKELPFFWYEGSFCCELNTSICKYDGNPNVVHNPNRYGGEK